MLKKIEPIIRVAAVCIAAIWTFFLFEYQNVILPSKEPLAAETTLQLTKIDSKDSFNRIKVSVNIKNVSKVPEKFVAGYFNAVGFFDEQYNIPDTSYNLTPINTRPLVYDYDYSAYEYHPRDRLCFAFSQILPDNTILQPNENRQMSEIITFPKNKYEYVRVILDIMQSKIEENCLVDWHKADDSQISPVVTITHGSDTTTLSFYVRNYGLPKGFIHSTSEDIYYIGDR
jgi:hypothetical protein